MKNQYFMRTDWVFGALLSFESLKIGIVIIGIFYGQKLVTILPLLVSWVILWDDGRLSLVGGFSLGYFMVNNLRFSFIRH